MGDTSIIARRRADGQVEYGWSGNGEYLKMVGIRKVKETYGDL